jgi:hypothetical protein
MAKPASNKAFRSQKNVRAMAGPVKYAWLPESFKKRGRVDSQRNKAYFPDCDDDNSIDNLVTYVYEILPDGNHSSYVECDYVD